MSPDPTPLLKPAQPKTAPIETARPELLGRLVQLPVTIGRPPSGEEKGWLGVQSDPLELALAIALGLRNANGVLVLESTVGGPAAHTGIHFGDIIVGLDGHTVGSPDELRERVAAAAPGDRVALEIWRSTVDDGNFLQTLRRLGEGGNAVVMHRLGRMYAGGLGVARDPAEAVRWFRKGATAGNLDCATMLAVALIEGFGTGKDVQEGLRLLRDAAAKGNLDAMHRLGALLGNGKVVDKDLPEAVRLITRAAEAGHAPAMVDLGSIYQQGIGVSASLPTAVRWYGRAADLGNSAGMLSLGVLHQLGKGVEQNDAAAVRYYRRSADLGNSNAFHNLAGMYEKGKGVGRRDPERAADFMMRALEMRNPFSYMHMTKNSRIWSVEFRRALQRRLRDAGFYTGRIDGSFGAPTIAAIDAYINRSSRSHDQYMPTGGGAGRW
jgi:TPR repeat protein